MTITVAPCQEIIRLRTMEDLRRIFATPDDVNEYNQVIFSTSGIHGSYLTIEDVEQSLRDNPDREERDLTMLVLQARCVTLCFGSIAVTLKDIPYLKELRQRSWEELVKLGAPRGET